MDIQALTLIGAIIAIVGSLLGAVLAIDQLTASYRNRRMADFLRATLGTDTLAPTQRKILTSVHGEAVGRVLSASAVPTWGLWGDVVLILVPAASAVFVGRDGLWAGKPVDAGTVATMWAIAALGWPTCWYGIRHVLYSLRERERLTRAYRRGRRLIRANRFHPFSNRRGTVIATVLTSALSLGMLGVGGILSEAKTDWSPLIALGVGYSLLLSVARTMRDYINPKPIRWIHPEPQGRWPRRELGFRLRLWHRLRPMHFVGDAPTPSDSE